MAKRAAILQPLYYSQICVQSVFQQWLEQEHRPTETVDDAGGCLYAAGIQRASRAGRPAVPL